MLLFECLFPNDTSLAFFKYFFFQVKSIWWVLKEVNWCCSVHCRGEEAADSGYCSSSIHCSIWVHVLVGIGLASHASLRCPQRVQPLSTKGKWNARRIPLHDLEPSMMMIMMMILQNNFFCTSAYKPLLTKPFLITCGWRRGKPFLLQKALWIFLYTGIII